MEIFVVDWLVVFIQDFLCDILGEYRKNFFMRLKLKKFQKELNEDIRKFCEKNECVYLNSSAFQFFIKHFNFVEELIARITATKISKSNKEFLRDSVNNARSIAEQEEMAFGHSEERLIKDLYRMINEKVTIFFSKMLSTEQRIAVYIGRSNKRKCRI